MKETFLGEASHDNSQAMSGISFAAFHLDPRQWMCNPAERF
jgi:hypothetical protein